MRSRTAPPAGAAVGYIRVSTTEQADSGLGLEAQRAAIQTACRQRGWDLVEVLEDAGASGKSLNGRPGLDRALDAIDKGRAGTLMVAKLDRLSRSLLDFAGLMERSTREGWSLVALDLGVDTTTPQGELMASVMATFAHFERRLIGQRTKDALAVKKAQGVQLGRPRVIDDETYDSIVDEIHALRAGGSTLRAITDHLNQHRRPTPQGGAQWHASSVRSVLLTRPPGA